MFKEQFSLGSQLETVFYLVPVLSELIGITAILMIDAGLARASNALHTIVQKFVMMATAMFGMALVGYGIWQAQYYKALGIPNPLKESIGDWWLFGTNITTLPQNLDPAIVPAADQLQLFWVFFVLFAGLAVVILHIGFAERMKMLPAAIIAFIFGAIAVPVYGYLVYGSVGPLSNHGVHDFAGVFCYVLIGTWSVIFAWRAGPRRGAFSSTPSKRPAPHNLILTGIGIALFLVALLAYVGGNGFLLPGAGYFGVAFNQTGFSFVIAGTVMAFVCATLAGIVLWRATGQVFLLLISPVAGYISVSGLVDVAKPWEAGLVAFFAPVFVFLVGRVLAALRIDDGKIGPLALGAGVYGAIVTGLVGSGDKVGGFVGGVKGYEPLHASISVGWQLVGVGVFLAGGLLSATVVAFLLEKTIGLRASEDAIQDGLDQATFGMTPYSWDPEPSPAAAAFAASPAMAAADAELPAGT